MDSSDLKNSLLSLGKVNPFCLCEHLNRIALDAAGVTTVKLLIHVDAGTLDPVAMEHTAHLLFAMAPEALESQSFQDWHDWRLIHR
jgi:hypothetical protein